MDQLKSGYMCEFLSCDEEKSIQKLKEFWQEIDVGCCCHPHSTEKKLYKGVVLGQRCEAKLDPTHGWLMGHTELSPPQKVSKFGFNLIMHVCT